MKILFQSSWLLLVVLACANSSSTNLTVEYEWKYIEYGWNSDEQKAAAVQRGQYDYTKIITNDVQQLPDGRVLITTPKYFDNPASLSTISSESGEGGPLLQPYPSWEWHNKAGNCSGITSVSRVRVDKCNRLWVVDSGKIENEQVCSAQILVFDALTDELLKKVEISDELSHNPDDTRKGRLEIQVVETIGDNCETTYAYIGDPEGWGLLIYNGTGIWRLNGERYAPDDGQTLFTIADTNVTLNLGVSSMLLPPEGFVKEEPILFKPLASVKGYAATREQMHKSYLGNDIQYYMCNFTIPSQELARDYSSKGILIAGFPTQTAVACWNLQNPLVDSYVGILERNEDLLQFISGLKITEKDEVEYVWVMSNKLQKFISGSMDFTEKNFYVLKAPVNDFVKGTNCEVKEHSLVDTIEDKFFLKM